MAAGRSAGSAPLLMLQLLSALVCACLLGTPAAARMLATKKREASHVVHLEQGFVKGRPMKTVYGFPYVSFLGIPYAQPPVGPRRFKEAVPHKGWNGLRDATKEGPPCPQYFEVKGGVYLGDEDCLFVNVFVPNQKNSSAESRRSSQNATRPGLLKVMVWIHGGGYVMGSANPSMFGPDFLVERGVIVVAINYRLGALGFMSMETAEAPGNYGLKDQVLALKWVRRNIRAFGGDPDDVTLFGESAGAASVHFHLLSKRSKGLFKRAIANSGTALSPWTLSRSPRQRTLSLAYALGLPRGSSDRKVIDFLSKVPPVQLVNHTRVALSPEDRNALFSFVFVPSIEPAHPGAFLSEDPSVLLAQGRFTRVPYLTGINSAEANFLLSAEFPGPLSTNSALEKFDKNFESVIGLELRINGRNNKYQAAKKIRKFYYGDEKITRRQELNTIKLLSDLFFQEGTDYVVRKMSATSSEPVHYYRFSYKGPNATMKDVPGVAHAEDLKYFFVDSRGGQNFNRTSEEGITRDRLIDMWTNFAKYGNPTPNITRLLTTKWSPYTRKNPRYLDINAKLKLGVSLDEKRMQFWHSLFHDDVK